MFRLHETTIIKFTFLLLSVRIAKAKCFRLRFSET